MHPSCCLAGELAAFAVDPSLSLLAVATNRNTLHLHHLAAHNSKPVASAAGSCKAHTASNAISKVSRRVRKGSVVGRGRLHVHA